MKTQKLNCELLISEAYENYRSQVTNYIFYKTDDYELAKDLTQDTFLRLLSYQSMICTDTIKSMIFTIARNLLYDHFRRHHKWQEVKVYLNNCIEKSYDNNTESFIIAKELLKLENEKLVQLSPQRRMVYVMSRYECKSVADISAILKISRRTIENHLFSSRKQIRNYIKECI